MDSVIRGNPITREAHYFLDGVLTDPSLPRITIRDPLGVAQVQDATPTRIGTGLYQFTYDVPLGAVTGIWVSEWSGVVAGQAVGPSTDDFFGVLPLGAIVPVSSSTYTYDLATSTGVVRLLIDDRDMSSVSTSLPLEQRSAIFADEEIDQFLSLAGQDVLRAAAKGLVTIAGNRSLLVQSRKVGKGELDFGPVRKDLLAQAEALIAQSISQPADGYVEQVWDDFALRRLITNTQLRMNSG
jgi:hypothetical protein